MSTYAMCGNCRQLWAAPDASGVRRTCPRCNHTGYQAEYHQGKRVIVMDGPQVAEVREVTMPPETETLPGLLVAATKQGLVTWAQCADGYRCKLDKLKAELSVNGQAPTLRLRDHLGRALHGWQDERVRELAALVHDEGAFSARRAEALEQAKEAVRGALQPTD